MAVSDELRQRQKGSTQAYFLDCLYLFWNMEHIIGWEGSEMVSVSGQTLILIFCWRVSFLLFFSRCFLNGNSPDKVRCAAQMILLAGPGVVISTFFLGASLKVSMRLVFRINLRGIKSRRGQG
ncbi:hypothetical protein P3L10_022509 [Capsicum annuum]